MPPFKKNMEQDLINARIKASGSMSEREFLAKELSAWEYSPARNEMIDGERYYEGDHDILRRRITAKGNNGELVNIDYLPNNKIVNNLYAKHADQKKNYLLGNPQDFTFTPRKR